MAMAGDSSSQATFSQSVTIKIRRTYDYRCVICLNLVQVSRCTRIIDAASKEQQQPEVCTEIVDVVSSSNVSAPRQSNLAFYLKIIKRMQRRMAWFVSEESCNLYTRIDPL